VAAYTEHWTEQFNTLHENEEELNKIFLKIYDLEDELSPDVPLEDVTILKEEAPDRNGGLTFREDVLVKQFLSYAVGCFFGRYSPNKDGLVLANTGDGLDAYREKVGGIPPYLVTDNVLPLADAPYFGQDILVLLKAFLAETFGRESVSENIDYIAATLAPSSRSSSEDVIRAYFSNDFYRDHKRMYKNRPIYWLCSTGRDGAFAALFYLHRYEPTLLATVRHDYLLRLQAAYQSRLKSLEGDSAAVERERAELQRRIQSIQSYDTELKNLADSGIRLDLDDGVKVNIAKFEGVVEQL
jgi:type II restriction/modification system DNA methylase subunit YeeA